MYENESMKEGDLVLNPNEFAFIRDDTKGNISCACGPYKTSLSTSDKIVVYNEKTRSYEVVKSKTEGIQKVIIAPENWYVELKNPAADGSHPKEKQNDLPPALIIGKKVNIKGNCSFALYPGQMAKVIPGHTLKSNQYLLAKVYDADVLNKADTNPFNSENNEKTDLHSKDTEEKKTYVTGELIVIKGSDVPFYIPPTGIKVIATNSGEYIRDAVTLEKLEYCILINEKGEKKYVHGPAVVFPKPDEQFVSDDNGSIKYRAIELSPTSGIYVKVIGEYVESEVRHCVGEELFITGKEQMIYYPKAEHAIIDYKGRIVHHATEIPAGEGRYVLNRLDGIIRTVKGPTMYLPNPIEEVFVQRKLTQAQCEMWYPGNKDVLHFNTSNGERKDFDEDNDFMGILESSTLQKQKSMLRAADSYHPGFSRGTTYEEPRTLTIDNKYKGAVTIDIWTGYAVNVVSKSGTRKVVVGPRTYIMDYDESLEIMELSTGKPKTTDRLIKTVYLRVENNKISDIINVETKDNISCNIKVSYCVNFLTEYMDKWFLVENYVKFLCDAMRSLVKREIKNYTIQEFYAHASEIIRNIILDVDYNQFEELFGDLIGNMSEEDEITENIGEESSVVNENNIEENPIVSLDKLQTLEENIEKSEEAKDEEVNELKQGIHDNDTVELKSFEGSFEGRLFNENGMFIKDVDILSVHINDTDMEEEIMSYQLDTIKNSLDLEEKGNELEILKRKSVIETEIEEIKKQNSLEDFERNRELIEKRNELETFRERKNLELNKVTKNAELELQSLITKIENEKVERERAYKQMTLNLIKAREEIKMNTADSYARNIEDVIEAISPDLISALQTKSNAEILTALTENMSPYAMAKDKSVLDVTVGLTKGLGVEELMKGILRMVDSSKKVVGDVNDDIPEVE